MEPILKGWVWNIPFYPCSIDGCRTVKNIFWYDSSNDLEFTKHKEEYQIVVPESEIIISPVDLLYVRKNLDRISRENIQIITPINGKWVVCDIPWQESSKSFLSLG